MSDTGRAGILDTIERSVVAAASRGRTVTEVGPFLAVIDPVSTIPWHSGAWPRLRGTGHGEAYARALPRLEELFAAAGREARFEFFAPLYPDLPAVLERAGYGGGPPQPIMTCGPGDLSPRDRPGIVIRPLRADAREEDLLRFIDIRDRAFEDRRDDAAVRAMARAMRDDLRAGHVLACMALLDGEPAGAGSTQGADGVAELAGIATLRHARRRGVASAVSAWLVREHHANGGTLAWLTAGDAAAEAVYRGIGFQPVGAQQLGYARKP